MTKLWGFVLGLVCLSAPFPLAAQNAALVGIVQDAQEAAIANATVTLTNVDTGVS